MTRTEPTNVSLAQHKSPRNQVRSPNLKQDLRAHTEEAVHHPECEDHWHTIDVPTRQMLALSHKTRHIRDTNKLKNQGSDATDS